jgi:hypothetical protein
MLRTIPDRIAPEEGSTAADDHGPPPSTTPAVSAPADSTATESTPAANWIPSRRRLIHEPADYEVALPEWLKECVRHVPPGSGDSCPTDTEALLASAFDFAYQLHEGQFRATGEPYIVHPIAVADLLRDIGASAAVIAAGFLHDVVEDTEVTPQELEEHFGAEGHAAAQRLRRKGRGRSLEAGTHSVHRRPSAPRS